MKGKKIVFINQSPNKMLSDIAAVYSQQGYSCTLLCGNDAIVEGFPEIFRFQKYDRSSGWSRLTSWMRFTSEVKQWLKNNRDFQELFLVSNPPFLFYLPLRSKMLKTKKMSFLIYDLYPDILKKMLPRLLVWLPVMILSYFNRKSFRLAASLYVPSQSLNAAVSKYTSQPVKTIYNWVDLSHVKPIEKSQNPFLKLHNIEDKFIVLYSGNLGRTHDVETMLECSSLLRENKSILFLFIGHGEGMEKVRVAAGKNSNIMLLGWQEEKMFLNSVAAGDVAWVGYKKGFEDYSIPSKLPFFLATGTTVISIGNSESELSRLLVENNIGFSIANNDVASLSQLLTKLATEKNTISENCISFAEAHFSRKNAEEFI